MIVANIETAMNIVDTKTQREKQCIENVEVVFAKILENVLSGRTAST